MLTYAKGGTGVPCSFPRSYADSCRDHTTLNIHYQANTTITLGPYSSLCFFSKIFNSKWLVKRNKKYERFKVLIEQYWFFRFLIFGPLLFISFFLVAEFLENIWKRIGMVTYRKPLFNACACRRARTCRAPRAPPRRLPASPPGGRGQRYNSNRVREDTHKKSVFFSGRTTKGVGKVNPPDH